MNPVNSNVFQNLSFLQIAFGGILIVVATMTSRFLKLDLEKDFLIASSRTIVQLLAVGFLLRWILSSDSLIVNLISLFIMSVAAAQAVTSRLKKKTLQLFLTAQVAIIIGVWPLGLVSMGILFQAAPFFKAALFIPFMGVLLGNALSAISLTLLGLQRIQTENMLEIETFMALGANPLEACQRLYRELLKQALTPIINGMTIVGIVSLPGVMAGQILGGIDPLLAAQAQILLMLLVLVTSISGALAALILFHFYFMPSWLKQEKGRWIFRIPNSNRLALVGQAGCGKSRLLKSLVGIDEEAIRKDYFSRSEFVPFERISGSIIYLHQKPYFVPGTVEENLRWPLQFKAQRHLTYDSELTSNLLKAIGLNSDVLNQSATNLSGGEAQLIHLVRALILKPEIFYLDEPTASLDVHRVTLVENLINNWLTERESRRYVIISHSFEQIKRLCTNTIFLRDRKLDFV